MIDLIRKSCESGMKCLHVCEWQDENNVNSVNM